MDTSHEISPWGTGHVFGLSCTSKASQWLAKAWSGRQGQEMCWFGYLRVGMYICLDLNNLEPAARYLCFQQHAWKSSLVRHSWGDCTFHTNDGFLYVGFCGRFFSLIVFCQKQAMKLHAYVCRAEGQSETWPEKDVCWGWQTMQWEPRVLCGVPATASASPVHLRW